MMRTGGGRGVGGAEGKCGGAEDGVERMCASFGDVVVGHDCVCADDEAAVQRESVR